MGRLKLGFQKQSKPGVVRECSLNLTVVTSCYRRSTIGWAWVGVPNNSFTRENNDGKTAGVCAEETVVKCSFKELEYEVVYKNEMRKERTKILN